MKIKEIINNARAKNQDHETKYACKNMHKKTLYRTILHTNWKQKFSNITGLSDCKSQEQLLQVNYDIKSLEKIIKKQDVPCIDIHLSTVWNFVAVNNAGSIDQSRIKFIYQDKYYEEVLSLKEFGPESFISNLGGFVGIFLGYSMMQLPDLLGKCVVIV